MSGFVTPAKLQLLNVVKQGRVQGLQEYAVMNTGIDAGSYEKVFDHYFHTAAIYPVFTPNWNTTVFLDWITETQFKVRFGTAAGLNAALTYRISVYGGSLSVTAADTSATLTHNLNDATAIYLFTPDWHTTIYAKVKAANTITLGFSNQPIRARTIRYVRFNADSQSMVRDGFGWDGFGLGQFINPVQGAGSDLITHNQGRFTHAFFTPSWNTTVVPIDRTRTDTSFQVRYQVEPQVGQNLDIVTAEPLLA